MTDLSLTAAELEEKLDELLESVLSSRRTAAPLAEFERPQQDFTLRWVDNVRKLPLKVSDIYRRLTL